MDLAIYDIIRGPLMTEKAYILNKKYKKLVLSVHTHANKPLIKEALEKLFNVQVKNIRIICRKGKKHLVKRKAVVKPLTKKAIVTLKEGFSIDIWDQPGSAAASEKNVTAAKKLLK